MVRAPRPSPASPRPSSSARTGASIRPSGSAAPRSTSPAATPSRRRAGDKSARVTWEVFATPAPKAKNVILFIGDGLSVAHRTAARMLSKGIVAGPLRRRARDRRHAAHGAGLDLGHRLARDRQRQQRERLRDRPQVLRQRDGRLLRAQQEQSRSPEGRDHLRAGEAPARHVGRRRHQHRDRGRDAGRDGDAQPPARRLQQHREGLLRRAARGDPGRRHAELPGEVDARLEAHRRGRLYQEIPRRRLRLRHHQRRARAPRRARTSCSACSTPATSTARSTASS